MTLESNLREMERGREAYWLRYPATSPVKLRWRAVAVRHSFHVLPGESILDFGAGSGLWTEHLATVCRGEAFITAAVFNEDLWEQASRRKLPNTTFVHFTDLARDVPAESFDYVVGTAILCHDAYALNLKVIHRLLKSGGQLLFFEANFEFYKTPRSAAVYNLGGGRANRVSILEAIERCQDLTGKTLTVEYVETSRLGDHITYISDLRRPRADYPHWEITRFLDDIFRELTDR